MPAVDRTPGLRVVKTRWSGESSVSFPVDLIGDDGWGTWVVSAAETRHVHDDGSVLHVQPTAIVGLIPRSGLWTAWRASAEAIIREAAELRSAIDSSTEPFGRVGRDLLSRFDQ